MSAPLPKGNPGAQRKHGFPTTRWTDVLDAGGPNSTRGARALDRVCTAYWSPVYAFIRHKGHSIHQAQDLTQAFFEFLLQHNTLSRFDPARGRFRSFLVGSLGHFLVSQQRRRKALSRGGGRPVLSLDLEVAENSYARVARETDSPEHVCCRRWALNLLELVFERLRKDFERSDDPLLFEALKDHIWAERGATPYEALSKELGISAGALRVHTSRLRRRYRELLRAEIRHYAASPDEVEQEIRSLIDVVSS